MIHKKTKKRKFFLILFFYYVIIPVGDTKKRYGGIAQLVEQMTFNHWVQGSSPCASTRKIIK